MVDDYSRHLPAGKPGATMAATDAQETLEGALAKSGLDRLRVRHRPRLLSNKGPCHVCGERPRFLESRQIERYHPSTKNLAHLHTFHCPWDLEQKIGCFVDYYNH